MDPIEFPPDFLEFLKLLNDKRVEYLLVGGFVDINGVGIPVIALVDLKRNKEASGRAKDIADLENLP